MKAGFSLLELLIVLAALGILLATAIPSWQRYAARANRADAIRLIMESAACLERSRAVQGAYNTAQCRPPEGTGIYRLRISPADEPEAATYAITAVPLNTMRNDLCGELTLDDRGSRSISGDPAARGKCWAGR